MILLPPIGGETIVRPGEYVGSQVRMVPDPEKSKFWNSFYRAISKSGLIYKPVRDFKLDRVNNLFGYFGPRFHPAKHEPYFHIGIDISGNTKNSVFPIANSILEYSGFGVINGNYVLLRHDDIQTEDGYKLFSMYAHLKKYSVGFTNYQKMLREISLRTYPEISVPRTKSIGTIGDSGNAEDGNFHLHLQFEFRKDKEIPIAVDPIRVFGHRSKENITSDIKNIAGFKKIYNQNLDEIKKHALKPYWDDVI